MSSQRDPGLVEVGRNLGRLHSNLRIALHTELDRACITRTADVELQRDGAILGQLDAVGGQSEIEIGLPRRSDSQPIAEVGAAASSEIANRDLNLWLIRGDRVLQCGFPGAGILGGGQYVAFGMFQDLNLRIEGRVDGGPGHGQIQLLAWCHLHKNDVTLTALAEDSGETNWHQRRCGELGFDSLYLSGCRMCFDELRARTDNQFRGGCSDTESRRQQPVSGSGTRLIFQIDGQLSRGIGPCT